MIPTRWLAVSTLAFSLLSAGTAAAQEPQAKKPGPPIAVEAVLVEPANPGPDTLCKLRVRLRNNAKRSVSGFGFEVRVNGEELTVYDKQRYLESLEPGEAREIELYNFWSSETGRPPKPNGALAVEVKLIEARWVEKKMEDEVPVWTLLDKVDGLPSAASAQKPFDNAPASR